MNKREFIVQYIMNRTVACTGDLIGEQEVQRALNAWNKIEEICPLGILVKNLEEEIQHAVELGFDRDYTTGEMTELILTSIKGEQS